ncbi:MAG: hypothetical protein ACFFEA_10160 [Candidatus Thorarchaeota archaeon]
MPWWKNRTLLAIVASLVLVLSLIIIVPRVLHISQIPDSDQLWQTSESHQLTGNASFTVNVLSVEFTFLFREDVPLDAPIPLHFRVTFIDGTIEYLETSVNGLLMQPPRVVFTNHTSPQAAIVLAYGHEEWYSWYYAVSLG